MNALSAVADPVRITHPAPEPRPGLRMSFVTWSQYEEILRVFEGRHLRITYDRGELEIMTLYVKLLYVRLRHLRIPS